MAGGPLDCFVAKRLLAMTDLEPVADAEFAAAMARIGGWGAGRRVAVAVSGGADSLCLAWLASRWGKAVGLIVDHGLRAESGAEAAAVAARLAGFGIAARIARLELRRGTGLAARAREARYAALARMARGEGLLDVLVGHHAGDQAETVLIRREGRSGSAGLAAMSAVVETAEGRIARPLLDIEAGRLRATLRQAGIGWFEDPANADPAGSRVRLRQGLEGEPAEASSLVAAARDFAVARQAEDAATVSELAERVGIYPEGYALLSPGRMSVPALAALLRTIGGAPYPARTREVERLARDPRPATLAGVQLRPAGRLGEGFLVVREAAAMRPSVAAGPGVMWDRRFALPSDAVAAEGTTLGAVGGDAPTLRGVSALPSEVLRTLPALRVGRRITGIGLEGHPAFTPAIRFRPAVPLAGAGFFL